MLCNYIHILPSPDMNHRPTAVQHESQMGGKSRSEQDAMPYRRKYNDEMPSNTYVVKTYRKIKNPNARLEYARSLCKQAAPHACLTGDCVWAGIELGTRSFRGRL